MLSGNEDIACPRSIELYKLMFINHAVENDAHSADMSS